MAERTLIEAVRADVLDDPAFVQAIDEASPLRGIGDQPCLAWIMKEGLFPSPSALWPVEIDAVDLRSAWFGSNPVVLPNGELFTARQDEDFKNDIEAITATLRRATDLAGDVAAVWDRFLAPLRSGATKATGVPAGGAPVGIPRSVWHRPSTLIDIIAGEVHRLDDPEDITVITEWTAVMLVENTDTTTKEQKKKTGRPISYDWDKALFYLFKWIDQYGVPDDRGKTTSLVTQIIEGMGQGTPNRRQVEQELEKRLPAFNRYLLERGETTFPTFLLTLKPETPRR